MPAYVTQDDVDFVVRHTLRLYGDRRNRSSQYTDTIGQHCLAGQILVGLGLPVPGPQDGCNEVPIDATPTQAFYAGKGVDFDGDALRTIRLYQDAADFGVKWNEQRTWRHSVEAPYDFKF